jgi:poly-gamma-glutamate capsule biosynthesis protein CapA/YwtB (metallophosphatase superfamily)
MIFRNKKYKPIPVRNTFLSFSLLILLSTGCYSKPQRKATISFTGDIIMHIPVRTAARHHNKNSKEKKRSINNRGYDFLFEKTRSYLKKSDVTVGNMEFPISSPFKSVPWIFNCYPDVIPAMQQGGFSMMFIANNHILDQGPGGIVSTVKYLKKYGMDNLGVDLTEAAARKGIVKDINGIRTGFIGYTGVSNYRIPKKQNGYYINNFYSHKKIMEDIRNIRKRCDYLVMVVHTGNEYSPFPIKKDRLLLRKYVKAGVDLVIRHHPHILQPVEKIKRKDRGAGYIFYSLGNFISNQGSSVRIGKKNLRASTRDSVVVTAVLTKKGKKIIPDFRLLPITTINIKRDRNGKRVIQAAPLFDEIKRLKTRQKKSKGRKKIAIDKRVKILLAKVSSIKKVLFRNGGYPEIIVLEQGTGSNARKD